MNRVHKVRRESPTTRKFAAQKYRSTLLRQRLARAKWQLDRWSAAWTTKKMKHLDRYGGNYDMNSADEKKMNSLVAKFNKAHEAIHGKIVR